jgi:hypothetical protein
VLEFRPATAFDSEPRGYSQQRWLRNLSPELKGSQWSYPETVEPSQLNWITNFIWGIAVPLLEPSGNEAFLRCEVLPHAADAWYASESVKCGCEIRLTRYFYKSQPPLRTMEEIRADILALERETEGLLGEILGSSVQ